MQCPTAVQRCAACSPSPPSQTRDQDRIRSCTAVASSLRLALHPPQHLAWLGSFKLPGFLGSSLHGQVGPPHPELPASTLPSPSCPSHVGGCGPHVLCSRLFPVISHTLKCECVCEGERERYVRGSTCACGNMGESRNVFWG